MNKHPEVCPICGLALSRKLLGGKVVWRCLHESDNMHREYRNRNARSLLEWTRERKVSTK